MKIRKKSKWKKNRSILLAVWTVGLIFLSGSLLESAKLDPESETFYQKTHFLLTKDERKIFKNLVSAEARQQFIQYFWEIRDPDPFTEVNEFKEEIESRYEYVSNHLNEGGRPGWKSDRGRIYMLLGPPSQIDLNPYTPDPRLQGRLIDWYYDFYDLGSDMVTSGGVGIFLRFVDDEAIGVYKLDPLRVSLRALEVMEEMKYNYIARGPGRKYADHKLTFDFEYRAADKTILVSVDPRQLEYEEDGEKIVTRLNVDLIVFDKSAKGFKKHSLSKTLELQKEDLLERKSPLKIEIPVKLKKGKVLVDVILTDVMAGRKARKTFKLKIKK